MYEFDYARPVGGEFQVNTIAQGAQVAPQVVGLADGGFVIVWLDQSQSLGAGTASEIRGQRFDASGARAGAEFLVNEVTTTAVLAPRVAATDDGGFVVTWADQSTGVRARAYGAKAVAETGEFAVQGTTGTGSAGGSVAALDDGTYLITWQVAVPAGAQPARTELQARVFGVDNLPVGDVFTLSLNDSQPRGTARVAADGDGFLIIWGDGRLIDGQNLSSEIFAQRVSASGSKVGAEFRINTQSIGHQTSATPIGLSDGGFLVAWIDFGQIGVNTPVLKAQRLDGTGTKVGGEWEVATVFDATITSAVIPVQLADGRFAFGWSQDDNASGVDQVVAQLLDASGRRLGEVQQIAAADNLEQFGPSAALLASGKIVVTWTDGTPEVGAPFVNRGIQAVLYEAFAIINGTEDPDSISGTGASEIILASDGADTVDGGGGDDQISGGDGEDQLTGGAGDDVLAGDEDDDTLRDGGGGYNQMFGGQGNDTLVDSGISTDSQRGGGYLDGGVGNDVIEAQNGQFEIFGGSGDDDHPTGGDDRITLLNARSTSTIDAGDGDDVILTSATATATIFIRAGEGADRVEVQSLRGQYIVSLDAGRDTLALSSTNGGFRAADTIRVADFRTGADGDRLDLSAWLGGGALTGYRAGSNPFTDNYLQLIQRGTSVLLQADRDGDAVGWATLITFNDTTVRAFEAFNLGGFAQRLVLNGTAGVDTLEGADGDDVLRGFGGADTLSGFAGEDFLDGGVGVDRLIGGLGNDFYLVDNAADAVIERAGQGERDFVQASASYVLAADADVEVLAAPTSGAIDLTGNGLAQQISGGNGVNILRGLGGNDQIIGFDGDDQLYGGSGLDTLDGGAGGDLMAGGADNDLYLSMP